MSEALRLAHELILAMRDTDAEHWDALEEAAAELRRLHAALAEPEQEPVAWMYDLKQRGSFEGVSTEYSRVKLSIGENWVPLYTAPPQRKPLTPDQVFAIADQHPVEGFDPEIMAFARAIEAAHGIKGKA